QELKELLRFCGGCWSAHSFFSTATSDVTGSVASKQTPFAGQCSASVRVNHPTFAASRKNIEHFTLSALLSLRVCLSAVCCRRARFELARSVIFASCFSIATFTSLLIALC